MTITAHRIVAKRRHMEGVRKHALETGEADCCLPVWFLPWRLPGSLDDWLA